ncbi:cell division protein FtsL [Streptococcus dentiloxodontae]
MTDNKENKAVNRALQRHIRQLSRMEKAFYGAIILTAIIMSVAIVYLQGRNQEVKQQITSLNSKISDEKAELNNAKQEVNELTNSERIKEIASKAGLTINNDNIQNVE